MSYTYDFELMMEIIAGTKWHKMYVFALDVAVSVTFHTAIEHK